MDNDSSLVKGQKKGDPAGAACKSSDDMKAKNVHMGNFKPETRSMASNAFYDKGVTKTSQDTTDLNNRKADLTGSHFHLGEGGHT